VIPDATTLASSAAKADYQPSCPLQYLATRSNAIAARNYLISVGNEYCDVPSQYSWVVLISIGDAEILGYNYYGLGSGVYANCSDVAIGASWVIDHCSTCGDDNCGVDG
jgi:hypothetical protein